VLQKGVFQALKAIFISEENHSIVMLPQQPCSQMACPKPANTCGPAHMDSCLFHPSWPCTSATFCQLNLQAERIRKG